MLIKDASEFKKYVRIAGSISDDIIEASVPEAQEKYIRDILGDTLTTDLDEWHNMESQPSVQQYTDLLPYVQRALSRFTLYIVSPEIDVTLNEAGIGVVSNQNIAPASRDRVAKFDKSNEQRGWDNVETLLRFLEENKDDYPEWTGSDAYTLSIRNLVNSALEFDSIIRIDKSRLYFHRIRTILDDVDLLRIKPTISPDLFDLIISEIQSGSMSDANKEIYTHLQRAEVFFTAVDSLDRSKYDGTGVQINLQFMERDINMLKAKAESFLQEARKIMDNNPDDYPLYRDSDVYLGLDDDGNTQYEVFDNTDEDNKIFVMP